MVYVFLADGFEIIEALAPVDMMRRAGIEVKTVGVTGNDFVVSSCSIPVVPDISIYDFNLTFDAEAIVLPGGGEGTKNLENSQDVQNAIDNAVNKDIPVCAICAAPSVLGHKGLLSGKEATAYPSFVSELTGAKISDRYVVTDGNIITARGAGVCIEFGLEIVKKLRGQEIADRIRDEIQCEK